MNKFINCSILVSIFLLSSCAYLRSDYLSTTLKGTESHGVIFDNISQDYPVDVQHFACDASVKLSQKYPAQSTFQIVNLGGRSIFSSELKKCLVEKGFSVQLLSKPSAINTNAIHYILDRVDTNKAYLQLQISDGTQIRVLRKLGETMPPVGCVVNVDLQKQMNIGQSFVDTSSQEFVNNSFTKDAYMASPTQQVQATQSKEVLTAYDMANENSDVEIGGFQETSHSTMENSTSFYSSTPVWHMQKGSLMHQLEDFAKDEGWTLIWNADFDLDMKADSSFTGTFVEFIEQLFGALQNTRSGLRISIYKANTVLEVSGE